MIYTQKAAVLVNNVWRSVLGALDYHTDQFVFVLNSRIERVSDGQWRTYPMDCSDTEMEREIIALNIRVLNVTYPARPKVRR